MSTIIIRYDGTDITNDVIFSSASFEAQLGAFPGSFDFIVRDREQTLSFVTGPEVTLDIDGTRYFGGYVTRVTRKFAMPVDITTVPANVKSRFWQLTGVDYNILFDKRVIYNKADPSKVLNVESGTFTDQAAISKLVNDYLDLSADGLDTSTFVDEVADPTPTGSDFGWVPPGSAWRLEMDEIAAKTGALYYIDASKALHYQTAETISPTWAFADKPNHVTTFGFRDVEAIEDATRIVNDALLWGGSEFGSTGATQDTVFAEVENTTSQSAYGRWQLAEQHFNTEGYFEESGLEVRGNVIVYGDPGASGGDENRGLQNPQRNVKLSWFSNGVPTQLPPGGVVNIFLYTFGPPPLQLTLPLRSVAIRFPVPDIAEFQGFFGIQTSDPWSLWKYMKKIADATVAPTTTVTVVTSDGSSEASVPGTYVCTTPTPAPNGSTTTFTVPDGYVTKSTQVSLNGLIQRTGYEYTESDPVAGEFTFYDAPLADDQLWVCYYSSGA